MAARRVFRRRRPNETAISSALYSVGLWAESDFVFRIPKAAVVAAMLVSIGLNYSATLRRDRWRGYARRFERLPARTRWTAIAVAWSAAAAVFASSLGTSRAYRTSAIGVLARGRRTQIPR